MGGQTLDLSVLRALYSSLLHFSSVGLDWMLTTALLTEQTYPRLLSPRLTCPSDPLTVINDGWHQSFPKVKPKHTDGPLVACCILGHKSLPLNDIRHKICQTENNFLVVLITVTTLMYVQVFIFIMEYVYGLEPTTAGPPPNHYFIQWHQMTSPAHDGSMCIGHSLV